MNILASSTKMIKLNLKPIIDFFMKNMILVTDLFGSNFLLQSFNLSSCPILISPTNKQCVILPHSTVPSICIC